MGGYGKIRLSGGRRVEAVCLLLTSATVAIGSTLVFSAKARSFPELGRDLAEGRIVHLGRIKSSSQLQPALSSFDPKDRPFVADRIFEYVKSRKAPLPNVGALASITVPVDVLKATSGPSTLKNRIAESSKLGLSFIDCSLLSASELEDAVAQVAPTAPLAFSHFEHDFDVPKTREMRLDLLRLKAKDRVLIIAANADPLLLLPQSADNTESAAWREIFRDFVSVRAVDDAADTEGLRAFIRNRFTNESRAKEIEAFLLAETSGDPALHEIALRTLGSYATVECVEIFKIRARFAVEVRPLYTQLWNSSTAAERQILHHLAKYGFVSPRAESVLAELAFRNLVRLDPYPMLKNSTFREFVLSAGPPQFVTESSLPGETRHATSYVLGIAALAVGGVLLVTQQELLAQAAALVTTAFGGIHSLRAITDATLGPRASGGSKPQQEG
jgi:hypothetical protein